MWVKKIFPKTPYQKAALHTETDSAIAEMTKTFASALLISCVLIVPSGNNDTGNAEFRELGGLGGLHAFLVGLVDDDRYRQVAEMAFDERLDFGPAKPTNAGCESGQGD